LINIASGGRIILGDRVTIASALRANPLGLFQPCVLRAMGPDAEVVLGNEVGLSGTVLCAGASIQIGEGTIFGAGAMVIDNDFHSPTGKWDWTGDSQTRARAVRIGRGAFIGARAIILKGVSIGDRAIVGAGAVVTKDIPPFHTAVGNPARIFSSKHAEKPLSN
jgi:acetyltransferase-like isoleucine patch superfamily enzyme